MTDDGLGGEVIAKEGGSACPVSRMIASVAARLFASRGYDATSVREIVEAAGVTKPTLYYHYKSKEGLAHELLTRPLGEVERRIGAIVEAEGDPFEALVEAAAVHFDLCREDPDRARFMYALFFGQTGSSLNREFAQHIDRKNALFATLTNRAAEAGVIDPGRVGRFTEALMGLLVIHMMSYLYRGGPLGPELPRSLVGDLLRGFAAPVAVGGESAGDPLRGER